VRLPSLPTILGEAGCGLWLVGRPHGLHLCGTRGKPTRTEPGSEIRLCESPSPPIPPDSSSHLTTRPSDPAGVFDPRPLRPALSHRRSKVTQIDWSPSAPGLRRWALAGVSVASLPWATFGLMAISKVDSDPGGFAGASNDTNRSYRQSPGSASSANSIILKTPRRCSDRDRAPPCFEIILGIVHPWRLVVALAGGGQLGNGPIVQALHRSGGCIVWWPCLSRTAAPAFDWLLAISSRHRASRSCHPSWVASVCVWPSPPRRSAWRPALGASPGWLIPEWLRKGAPTPFRPRGSAGCR